MSKKVLSLFMAALMIFGGSFTAYAEVESMQDSGYPTVEIIPGIDNTNDLVGPMYVNENTGDADNGFVSITPLGGNLVKVYYHTAYYMMNEDSELVLADLNSIYYKAANSVFLVSFSPILSVGEYAIFELGVAPHPEQEDFRPAVSHITTFDMNFTPPTEIYGLISGVKYGEDGNPIDGVSFDFEVYWADDDPEVDDPVATAFSDPTTGVMTFMYFGDTEEFDSLELEPGLYKIYEVDLPEAYEFMHFIIIDGINISDPLMNGAEFEIIDDSTILLFNAFNRMKDSSIMAFKYDAAHEENTPFADNMFEFEVWIDVEEETGPIAIGQSQLDGSVLFFEEWDEEGPIGDGVTTLDLLYGNYIIKEINIPDSHEFVKFALIADDEDPIWSEEGDDPEIPFMAGDVDLFKFVFYNIEKTSELRAFKFNAESIDENIPGFTDFSFNFLVKDSNEEVVALGRSVMDGTGKVLFYTEWEMVEDEYIPVGDGVEVLVLPYGEYTIEELALMGYDYMGFMMYEDGELVEPGDPMLMVIPFMAGDVESFVFEFYNKKHIEYKEDTAYAYPGSMTAGGTLNSVIKSKNWGWYINATEGTFAIYAGAGQNNISKGVYVGDVTFSIVDNKYTYELDLLPGVEVIDGPHFGVYTGTNKIPNGPGLYTNKITAASANVLVLHLVVKYPIE